MRDEQAVERVFVVRQQILQRQRVRQLDGQDLQGVGGLGLAIVSASGRRKRNLPKPILICISYALAALHQSGFPTSEHAVLAAEESLA